MSNKSNKISQHNKCNLANINIENMFGSETKVLCTNGKLDINTLFKYTDDDECTNVEFDPNILLKGINKRKKKLNKTYAEFYKSCCDTIIKASEAGMTDILFEVPTHVIDCTDYVSYDCLVYIKEKLTDQHISTHIKSKKTIFITWHNLEKKLNESRQNFSETYQQR